MSNRGLAIVLTLSFSWSGIAAESGKDGAESKGLGQWSVEAMVDQASKEIIRRYNLNDDQASFTKQLMARRVNMLLDKHEKQVRELFREALAMRTAGHPPTAEQIKSWAERALPVYEDAKRHILEGNEEWGQILTPEQKRTHEIDLKMMKLDFAQYEQRLARWSKGGFDAKTDWVTPPSAAARPVRPSGATTGPSNPSVQKPAAPVAPPSAGSPSGPIRVGQSEPKPPTTAPGSVVQQIPFDPEHAWDVWVGDFIKLCRLDEAQTTQARAILKDCRERASRHRDAHRDDYLRVHRRLRELRSGGAAPEVLAEASKELADLDAPINDLFEELKARIEQIPTREQLQRYREAQPQR